MWRLLDHLPTLGEPILRAEHPGGLGKYQTKEELMDFIVSKQAPGPYSINPERVEQGTKPLDEDPFKPSVLDNK